MPVKGFYFITDSRLSRHGIVSDVKAAIKAGVEIVQYRQKDKTSRQMIKEAMLLRRICRKALFLINDRVDIALAVGADGVHLGQDDMSLPEARKLLGKNKIIGATVHNVKEALFAQKQGADYLGVSPIFPTRTKSDAGVAIGIKTLIKIRKKTRIPIVALGGINLQNAEEVTRNGADMVCAISAVVGKKDVYSEVMKFRKAFLG
jgi:thiamine-phosphate pyrophosphorylase